MEKEILSNPILWSPSDERIKSSQMFAFMQNLNEKYNLNLDSFPKLYTWSIENKTDFWSSVWDYFKIKNFVKLFFSHIKIYFVESTFYSIHQYN